MPQGAGNVNSSGGNPELEIKRGKAIDLQGQGMLPGSTIQIWLPGATRTIELGRINVSADGRFSGDVSFGSSLSSQPIAIGSQVVQLTGIDTTGSQTIINLNVNVTQPEPSPELFRGLSSTPAPGFGNFEASNAGLSEQATLTAISNLKQALVEGEGWSLSLQLDGAASGLSESPEGLFMTLVKGETASFGGSGFMPGTIASVWLFSDPTKLGEVVISEDGSFTGTTGALDENIATGDHTIQIQGVGQDGFIRSANLGVAVAAPALITVPTAFSGWAISGLVAMVFVGGFLLWILVARRRKATTRSNVIPFRRAA